MAIGMAIGVLVEVLLPSGDGTGSTSAAGGKPLLKDEKGEWIGNKLKALARLLRRLGAKAAEALHSILGAILSWILNRSADVVGWLSENL